MKKVIGLVVGTMLLVGCGAEVPVDITEAPAPVIDILEPITVTVPVFDAEDNVVGTEELEISLEDVTEIVESIEIVE
jgi:uncharacterized protein YcfL